MTDREISLVETAPIERRSAFGIWASRLEGPQTVGRGPIFWLLFAAAVAAGAVYPLFFDGWTVGNTAYYGGGLQICPRADPADGLLDVTIVHPVNRATLLRLFPLMYSGRFARNRCVEQLRARSVRVEGPGLVGFGDGEMLGAAPLEVAAAPGALRVLVPTRTRGADISGG